MAGGEARRFQFGRDLPGQWWTLFASNKRDALIDEPMSNYPDMAAQQAALRATGKNARAEDGVFSPQIQAAGDGVLERSSGAAIAPGFPGFVTNSDQATINISYTFDAFGAAQSRNSARIHADARC